MQWFTGSVTDAVRAVRDQSKVLLVFIKGLQLDAGSEATAQFSAVYAVLTVPCIYLISSSGDVLDVKLGSIDKEELKKWIVTHLEQTKNTIGQTNGHTSAAEMAITPIRSEAVESTSQKPTETSVQAVGEGPKSTESFEDRLQLARKALEKKRSEDAEKDRQRHIDDEIKRREAGKSLNEFKDRQKTREIAEALAERRKDERETKELRQRLLQQIEEDRRAFQARSGALNASPTDEPSAISCPMPSRPIVPSTTDRSVSTSTLAGELRQWIDNVANNTMDGMTDVPVIDDAVRTKLSDLTANGYQFRQLHPSRLFTPEEETNDMTTLDLCPSAVLILVPTGAGRYTQSTASGGLTSQLHSLASNGVQGIYSFTGWILSSIYSMASGLVTSFYPASGATRPLMNTSTGTAQTPVPKPAAVPVNRAVRRQGNMGRLSHLPDDSDDEQARWNGNSTEQL